MISQANLITCKIFIVDPAAAVVSRFPSLAVTAEIYSLPPLPADCRHIATAAAAAAAAKNFFQPPAINLFWMVFIPLLAKIVRVYLSISATSVPIEFLFSTTGIILSSKRITQHDSKQSQ